MGSQVPGKRNTILSMFQTLRQHLLQCDDLHFELQVAKLNRVFQTEINASKSESEIITTLNSDKTHMSCVNIRAYCRVKVLVALNLKIFT